MKKARNTNSDSKNQNKLNKTTEKLLKQANQSPEQKKIGSEKIKTL